MRTKDVEIDLKILKQNIFQKIHQLHLLAFLPTFPFINKRVNLDFRGKKEETLLLKMKHSSHENIYRHYVEISFDDDWHVVMWNFVSSIHYFLHIF